VIVYLDSSALLKLFLVEEGSPEVHNLWDQADRLSTSRITLPEARAALAAGARAGRLTPRGHSDAVLELRRRWRELHVFDLSEELAREAGDLAERYALRALDAIHLASALAGGRRVVMATWDAGLARAARDVPLAVTPAIGGA
jgi:predicted nucleic acid-binding protein